MRDLRDRLTDIRAAAADILAFVEGLDEAAFATLPETDRRTYRAIKNALAEIGEAIKQLPPEVLAAHREIDWRGFVGLRDIVAHQYFGVELPRLWPTVTEELPALLAAVDAEIARLSAVPRDGAEDGP
jgi:uncharacterized protein with HEPN domain